MKIEEMATAFQNLAYDVGTNLDEMAHEIAGYGKKLTESYTANGASGGNSASYILKPAEELFAIDTTSSITTSYYRPRRLKCNYCGCISGKESGTCEHCGAPLVEDEY